MNHIYSHDVILRALLRIVAVRFERSSTVNRHRICHEFLVPPNCLENESIFYAQRYKHFVSTIHLEIHRNSLHEGPASHQIRVTIKFLNAPVLPSRTKQQAA